MTRYLGIAFAIGMGALSACVIRDGGNPNPIDTTCAAGTSCGCDRTGSCTFDCPGGDCNFTCEGEGSCDLSCDGGGCDATCTGSGSCSLSCSGGDCSLSCQGAGSC